MEVNYARKSNESMNEQHIINTLPNLVECYHKENKRKRYYKGLKYKDIDYYKFVIIKNEKYQNDNSYVAGYFKFTKCNIQLERFLFKVKGIYLNEVYNNAIVEYERLKNEGLFIESKIMDENIWTGHSPYDK